MIVTKGIMSLYDNNWLINKWLLMGVGSRNLRLKNWPHFVLIIATKFGI